MWLMTKYGILMPAALPAEHRPRRMSACDMQVRSRDRETLARVRREMRRSGLVTSAVRATPEMDYEWRFYCKRDDFADWVRDQVAEIDFVKFKPTVVDDSLFYLYSSLHASIQRFYEHEHRFVQRVTDWDDEPGRPAA